MPRLRPTILRDYALPLGVVGQWLAGGFVERQIARMFAYRHETTKRIVESGRWAAVG